MYTCSRADLGGGGGGVETEFFLPGLFLLVFI